MQVEKTYRFESALVDDHWIDNAVISIDDGVIMSVAEFEDVGDCDLEFVAGVALPGIPNVHSHAFQRGFAGLSEYRTSDEDSFWTWRNLMYEFVWKLNPEDVYAIAKQVYLEMLRAGYTWVGEFHYLHNDRKGAGYSQPAEMAEALIKAAADAGIGMCLLPTLYQQGGFDRELLEAQRRFSLHEDRFFQIIDSCQSRHERNLDFRIGMAIHSLRAVDAEVGTRVVSNFKRLAPDRPIHIHVAEQIGEVEDCRNTMGLRPIELLFSNFDVDECWCLIHATHATSEELQEIADSGATVGLCPTTEANLGDGIFPAGTFLDKGGKFGVGSDSHVSINLASELRMLEYGQRLNARKRAVLGSKALSVGRRLYQQAAMGGGQSLAVETGRLAVGQRADLIVVDCRHPSIGGSTHDRLLDRLIFCEHGNPIARTMVGGNWVDVQTGLNNHRESFLEVLEKLCQ